MMKKQYMNPTMLMIDMGAELRTALDDSLTGNGLLEVDCGNLGN